MFASFLVLLDGSGASDAALDFAAALARKIGATVRGLHVEDERRFLYFPPINAMSAALGAAPTIPVPLPAADLVRIEQEVSAATDTIRERFAAVTKGLPDASLSVVRGDVLDEMIDRSHRCDMVIMGCRHSRTTEGATDPGTLIEPLLRQSNRPVVLVPPGHTPDFNHLMMAYDASDTARRALRECAALAKATGGQLDVITVTRNPADAEPAMEEAREYLAPWKLATCTVHHRSGRARDQIVAHAHESKTGLLAMGAFGHNRVSEFLFGSATRHLLEHLPCPVLLARF